jgi:hypothetical protein
MIKVSILLFIFLLPFILCAEGIKMQNVASLKIEEGPPKKGNVTFVFVQTLATKDHSANYQLTRISLNNKEKIISLKDSDAKILIAQMNDMIWDFEYKRKRIEKSKCKLVVTLEANSNKTLVCAEEKMKISKIVFSTKIV